MKPSFTTLFAFITAAVATLPATAFAAPQPGFKSELNIFSPLDATNLDLARASYHLTKRTTSNSEPKSDSKSKSTQKSSPKSPTKPTPKSLPSRNKHQLYLQTMAAAAKREDAAYHKSKIRFHQKMFAYHMKQGDTKMAVKHMGWWAENQKEYRKSLKGVKEHDEKMGGHGKGVEMRTRVGGQMVDGKKKEGKGKENGKSMGEN